MVGDVFETVPKQVTAVQWNEEGDHPDVIESGIYLLKYRCGKCGGEFNKKPHGVIYTPTGGNKYVCPGDYVLSTNNGYKVMPAKEFNSTFRLAEIIEEDHA